jgi:hypothetical protein
MKKVLLLAAMSVLAAALLIPTAFAGNASANKVNGDLWFTNASGPAHWVFNAQDLTTGDKGSVFYQDVDGVYTGDVIDADVKAKSTTFTAKVTSSTIYYAHANDTFTWTVYDGGEGSNGTGDNFTFNSAVLGGVEYHPSSTTPYPITAGNIQVHFNG